MSHSTLEHLRPESALHVASEEVLSCPASFAQRRLWFLYQLAPESTAYTIATARRVRGAFDPDAFGAACLALVARQEALRTTFAQEGGEPVQVLHPPPRTIDVPLVSLEYIAAHDRERELQRLVAREAATPFDLTQGPLFRVRVIRLDADDHVITISLHHIVSDGWSMVVLNRELDALYRAAVAEPDADPARLSRVAGLEPLPIQYADYSVWQRDWLSGDELKRQEEYWLERLRGPLPQLELPTDRPRRAVQRDRGAAHSFTLSAELTANLRALSRREGATLFMTLLAAYEVLLHRYSGQEDIVIGTPIAGRTRSETEGLIGCFVNTLALRADLSGAPPFTELLRRVRADTLDAYARQDLPFEHVVELLRPDRDRSRMPVFQTMFVLQNTRDGDGTGVTFGGLPATGVSTPVVTSKFDLQLTFSERGGQLVGGLVFDTDLFDADTIQRFAAHLERLLHSIVATPEASVDALVLMDDSEQERIQAWSSPRSDYPRAASVPQLFAEWVARTPTAVAVEQGKRRTTYEALDAASDAVADALRAGGIAAGALVAIALPRSPEAIVAILGVLKAGAGYVPLDPEYPIERLAFMLDDTAAATLITTQAVPAGVLAALDRMTRPRPTVLDISAAVMRAAAAPARPPHPAATGSAPAADDVAYVMFTSGSTGRPKGVVVPHRAIVRLVRDTNFAEFGPEHAVLGFAPMSFDASTLEIWGALLNGGRIVLAPSGRAGLEELAETVREHGVTTMWLTAALFNRMVDAGLEPFVGVRQLLTGGDVLSIPHVVSTLRALPAVTLINGYGPTENTTFTTCYTIPADFQGDHSVPIGRPVANTSVYVLDAARRPVPIGVVGELYAGGDGVALGYLHQPELTTERFVPDPFADRPGARMYRTGDLVRWRADGTLAFLGRADDQVKIRGFRVEPGEAEAALQAHPAIRGCVVTVDRAAAGGTRLVAYYATADSAENASPSQRQTELRSYLRARLPEYMVPAVFVAVDALPVGATGKVDRSALPPVPSDGAEVPDTYVAPRTTLEHELVHIWGQLLGRKKVGIRDDFFDLGGHSLLAAQMIFEIERVRGRRLPLAALFEDATIERIAARLEAAAEDEAEPDVVVLHPAGHAAPFAFLHGDVRGGGWYCRRLAAILGTDVPLIVLPTLQPRGESDLRTIEQMARHHLATLRRAQPSGPYRLGGFCVGGLVAFEMARQLRAEGEVVERVVLVDSTGVNARFRWIAPVLDQIAGGNTDAVITRRAGVLRWLRYYTGRLRGVRRMRASERWAWLRTNVHRRMSAAGRVARIRRAESVEFTGERFDRSPEFDARPATRLLRMQERAAVAYVPRGFDGRVDVVWAADEFPASAGDRTRGWARAARDVRVHMISSAHVGLITYDLEALGTTLRACLGETAADD